MRQVRIFLGEIFAPNYKYNSKNKQKLQKNIFIFNKISLRLIFQKSVLG